MEINEGDILEYTGPKQTAMTIGKFYKVWDVISSNHSIIVVKNDINQCHIVPGAYLGKMPMITDSGAAEYEEIMASIGETEP